MVKDIDRVSITLKDIAREAGVSLGTASNVINGRDIVSEKLRRRVEDVVERLGYRPSALARSIKRNRSMVIGLIIPKIKNSFYIQIIDMVEKLVQAHGYTFLLGNSDEELDVEVSYLRTFATMRVDGLLLASSGRKDPPRINKELAALKQLGIPIVFIVRFLDSEHGDSVVIDNEGGAYNATLHALDNGHRRVAILSSPIHTSASMERIKGYRRAFLDRGLIPDHFLERIGEESPDSGYLITQELLNLTDRPSLLFVATNYHLIGCLRAVHDAGLQIPSDISVICFDDPEWSPYLNPPLTAVRPDTEALCWTAVNFLLDRIEERYSGGIRCHVVPTSFIQRSSVLLVK